MCGSDCAAQFYATALLGPMFGEWGARVGLWKRRWWLLTRSSAWPIGRCSSRSGKLKTKHAPTLLQPLADTPRSSSNFCRSCTSSWPASCSRTSRPTSPQRATRRTRARPSCCSGPCSCLTSPTSRSTSRGPTTVSLSSALPFRQPIRSGKARASEAGLATHRKGCGLEWLNADRAASGLGLSQTARARSAGTWTCTGCGQLTRSRKSSCRVPSIRPARCLTDCLAPSP